MVYVDPLRTVLRTSVRWPWPMSCHLYADTEDELHRFASRIQLHHAWFQGHDRLPHYDLTAAKRAWAVRAGAVEVTSRQMVERLRARRRLDA